MPPGLPNMNSRHFELQFLSDTYAVCRLSPTAELPAWVRGELLSVSRTPEELSIVCPDGCVPEGVQAAREWRCFRIKGSMPFDLLGVVASLTATLAHAGIPVFVISTFDTDYILIKETDRLAAVEALVTAGHTVHQKSLE